MIAIVSVGFALIYFWFRQQALHYRVTNERVVVEVGFLSKRMDQIDIYRITDYVVERPLGQRIMGTGNIVLSAMDPTTPHLRLDGLKTDVLALYERKATETARRHRNVRVVDYE